MFVAYNVSPCRVKKEQETRGKEGSPSKVKVRSFVLHRSSCFCSGVFFSRFSSFARCTFLTPFRGGEAYLTGLVPNCHFQRRALSWVFVQRREGWGRRERVTALGHRMPIGAASLPLYTVQTDRPCACGVGAVKSRNSACSAVKKAAASVHVDYRRCFKDYNCNPDL